ncbi:hypothetical protein SAMN05428963_10258 [Consotaella salsifontis]|uniref:Uncharacterized protein n=1 Tax=Consotaella salsifontis TaxID=1365950 RepID=A0A1T4MBD5_9HYPH|nr:hypothetical protein SAMN05428963_10258 [Consotaella salsifontis]
MSGGDNFSLTTSRGLIASYPVASLVFLRFAACFGTTRLGEAAGAKCGAVRVLAATAVRIYVDAKFRFFGPVISGAAAL